jgi:hypothetical protein
VRDNAIQGGFTTPQRVRTHDIAEHDAADGQQARPDLLEASVTRKIAEAGPFCRFIRQNLVDILQTRSAEFCPIVAGMLAAAVLLAAARTFAVSIWRTLANAQRH